MIVDDDDDDTMMMNDSASVQTWRVMVVQLLLQFKHTISINYNTLFFFSGSVMSLCVCGLCIFVYALQQLMHNFTDDGMLMM